MGKESPRPFWARKMEACLCQRSPHLAVSFQKLQVSMSRASVTLPFEINKYVTCTSFLFVSFFLFFNFAILYWFCHISTWIHHRYTRVPQPESSSLLPPGTIPLGRPSVPAPSIQYHASNLGWRLISYMILYMFQCHSPKSSHPLSLTESKRLFYTSVSLLLSRTQGYCYHLSKFYIYALVYWPSNPTAGHTHWGNQNWKRHVYPNVHHSTVYNSHDMEAT